MTSYNPFLGFSHKTSEEMSEIKAKKEEEKANQVPSGTVSEVLQWVGDNQDRAERALAVEKNNNKPRKVLVKELKALISD